MTDQSRFYLILGLVLLGKILFAGLIPITGDEAYFVVWANHPDYGYYDHPPMVAWLISPLLWFGQNELSVRLPAILTNLLIALSIYRLLKPATGSANWHENTTKARLIALLFVLLPASLFNVFITTDTPLILFSFLSALFMYKALQHERLYYSMLSGAFLGAAVLSKYLVAVLGISYLALFLFYPPARRHWKHFLLMSLCTLPFVLLNLYWNYSHCWTNILFNLLNRNRHTGPGIGTLLVYLATLLYLYTPLPFYYLYRWWRNRSRNTDLAAGFWLYLGLVPLALFALIALKKTVGLHWLFAFVPFLLIALHRLLTSRQLHRLLRLVMLFTVVHALVFAGFILAPLDSLSKSRVYRSLVFGYKQNEILAQLARYEKDYVFATDSYSPSAVMAFYRRKPVLVFGKGSYHGRQDDLNTDYRRLDGKNILILSKSKTRLAGFTRFFRSSRLLHIRQQRAVFHVLLGQGFIYDVYRREILAKIRREYYPIPSFLPYNGCYFYQKYGK